MASHRIFPYLGWFLAAWTAMAAEHHGAVKSAGLAVPGATVTASQGEKKFVTTTDDQGAYTFADLPDGVWTIQVEMFGFGKLSREVGIAPNAPSPEWELKVLSLSALKQESAPAVATAPARATPSRAQGTQRGGVAQPSLQQAIARNGFQRLDVNASAGGATPAGADGLNGGAGNEILTADLNQSASDAFVVNGSVSTGLDLPQQNDWFGFGRGGGIDGVGFGLGGPDLGGPGGPGGPAGPNAAA